MSKLDELKKRERELLYQLEDNGKENYRTKELSHQRTDRNL